MSFSREYYENKRKQLEQRRIQKMGAVIQEITNFLNNFYADLRDIDERIREIGVKEQEAQKEQETPKGKKPKKDDNKMESNTK